MCGTGCHFCTVSTLSMSSIKRQYVQLRLTAVYLVTNQSMGEIEFLT